MKQSKLLHHSCLKHSQISVINQICGEFMVLQHYHV